MPVFKDVLINLGWFYLAFGAFVVVGAANAVNFTDGLDGLATVPVMIAAAAFGPKAPSSERRGQPEGLRPGGEGDPRRLPSSVG